MITAKDILEALEENLEMIRGELTPDDWSRFRQKLVSLQESFIGITDPNTLEAAVDFVWQACLQYPLITELIQSYSTPHQMRPPPGRADAEDEIPIPGIANRFQALFARLEEMEWPTESKSHPGNHVGLAGKMTTDDR